MASTKTLQLTFKNDEGKKKSLSLPNAAPDLPEAEVKTAMDTISNAGVFEKDGVALYVMPVSAQYVERITTPVFEADTEAEEA